ncbi:MAG: diguanylate cyclase, partial [Pseudomonadota bacterium]
KEFARRIQANVRSMDLVARMGGEEFMVVMPEISPEHAAEIAERVRSVTEAPTFRISENDSDPQLPITVSIGYAVLGAEETAIDLINRADAALYASKNEGRNRVTLAAA